MKYVDVGRVALAGLLLTTAGCSTTRPVSGPALPHGFVVARPVAPLFDPALAPARLDSPSRDRWQRPEQIVRSLGLPKGETVADIGSGSGYLLPYLSRAVGKKGTVLAEEIQEEFLPPLRRRARQYPNVRVLLGTAEDPKLPTRKVGAFVLLTVYHEVDHPVDFLRTLRRYARPDTKLAIIDFDAGRKGDPPAPNGHEVAESAVVLEAKAAGWEVAERHEFISSQFFLVFRQKRNQATPAPTKS